MCKRTARCHGTGVKATIVRLVGRSVRNAEAGRPRKSTRARIKVLTGGEESAQGRPCGRLNGDEKAQFGAHREATAASRDIRLIDNVLVHRRLPPCVYTAAEDAMFGPQA